MVVGLLEKLGGDESVARRVLVTARIIAPCIDSFAEESEEQKNALAILRGVIAELPGQGSRRTRSMSRNGTSMSFADVKAAFTEEDKAALRSLCPGQKPAGLPQGSFPAAGDLAGGWPEGPYS